MTSSTLIFMLNLVVFFRLLWKQIASPRKFLYVEYELYTQFGLFATAWQYGYIHQYLFTCGCETFQMCKCTLVPSLFHLFALYATLFPFQHGPFSWLNVCLRVHQTKSVLEDHCHFEKRDEFYVSWILIQHALGCSPPTLRYTIWCSNFVRVYNGCLFLILFLNTQAIPIVDSVSLIGHYLFLMTFSMLNPSAWRFCGSFIINYLQLTFCDSTSSLITNIS